MLQDNDDLINKFTDQREIEYLRDQTQQINRLLQVLRINRRHARSLDFIGTALKLIAGTPDRSDFDLLTTKGDMLIQNNNRQTTINSALQDKINELTDRINKLQYEKATSNAIGGEEIVLFELMSARNSEIIFLLDQLTLSITLAKANIVNPIILDNLEIEQLKKK